MSRYSYLDRNDGSIQEHSEPDPDVKVDEWLQDRADNPCPYCHGLGYMAEAFKTPICLVCEGSGVKR